MGDRRKSRSRSRSNRRKSRRSKSRRRSKSSRRKSGKSRKSRRRSKSSRRKSRKSRRRKYRKSSRKTLSTSFIKKLKLIRMTPIFTIIGSVSYRSRMRHVCNNSDFSKGMFSYTTDKIDPAYTFFINLLLPFLLGSSNGMFNFRLHLDREQKKFLSEKKFKSYFFHRGLPTTFDYFKKVFNNYSDTKLIRYYLYTEDEESSIEHEILLIPDTEKKEIYAIDPNGKMDFYNDEREFDELKKFVNNLGFELVDKNTRSCNMGEEKEKRICGFHFPGGYCGYAMLFKLYGFLHGFTWEELDQMHAKYDFEQDQKRTIEKKLTLLCFISEIIKTYKIMERILPKEIFNFNYRETNRQTYNFDVKFSKLDVLNLHRVIKSKQNKIDEMHERLFPKLMIDGVFYSDLQMDIMIREAPFVKFKESIKKINYKHFIVLAIMMLCGRQRFNRPGSIPLPVCPIETQDQIFARLEGRRTWRGGNRSLASW